MVFNHWYDRDDIIKRKRFPCYWSLVNSPHKGQWRGALMFSLICAWMNDWVNNRETGDLRRHRTRYDAKVMKNLCFQPYQLCLYITITAHDHHGMLDHRQLDSLLNRLFMLITNETPKVNITVPLCWESIGVRWTLLTTDEECGKCFNVMTSSWQMSQFWITLPHLWASCGSQTVESVLMKQKEHAM